MSMCWMGYDNWGGNGWGCAWWNKEALVTFRTKVAFHLTKCLSYNENYFSIKCVIAGGNATMSSPLKALAVAGNV